MYGQEKIKPQQDDATGKTAQVERMFDDIAPSYDRLNHRLSWNIDRWWRRKAIDQLAALQPQTVLDIATGTADLAIMAAQRLKPRHVTGADISQEMMKIGRKKIEQLGLQDTITLEAEDCMALSYPDESFDAVVAAFGIRNFQHLDQGLSEMCRVTKPGGQLAIAELTQPVGFPMKQLFKIYSHTVLPLYGKLISHNKTAYSYLTQTIEAFPQGELMTEILKKAGFREASFRRLTFGICTIYHATK